MNNSISTESMAERLQWIKFAETQREEGRIDDNMFVGFCTGVMKGVEPVHPPVWFDPEKGITFRS